ncbi:MAG: hypothetical protein K2N84_03180 [Clostridia bacterium]|nr:hypothetical protein [Clostridia bacterium]
MKGRNYIKCFFALVICSMVLFVSACVPRLAPLEEGTYLGKAEWEIESMPFPNMKLVFSEIDEEAFDEAEGLNVVNIVASYGEQKYYSFNLYVFLREENDFVQIDVVDLKKEETKWLYQGVTADSAKNYGIISIEFWVAPYQPIQYSWFTVTIRMEVDESEKTIDEPNDIQKYCYYDYRLIQNSHSPEEVTYLWETAFYIENVLFSDMKLVLTEIDKKTFDEAEGVNVICDEASSKRLKYFSFELYVFIEEENDFFKIDIIDFRQPKGTPQYCCETVDSQESFGITSLMWHGSIIDVDIKISDEMPFMHGTYWFSPIMDS